LLAPAIIGLFLASCPPAVGWLVVAVDADAIQGVVRAGLGSHIFQEGFKRVLPAVANGDATAPVVLPSVVGGVIAALLHTSPGVIFTRV